MKKKDKHEAEPADYVHIQHIFKGQSPLIDDLRRNRAFSLSFSLRDEGSIMN